MKTSEKRTIIPKTFEELNYIEEMQSTTSSIFMFLGWVFVALSVMALAFFFASFLPVAIMYVVSLSVSALLFFAIGNALSYLRKTSIITYEIWKTLKEDREKK